MVSYKEAGLVIGDVFYALGLDLCCGYPEFKLQEGPDDLPGGVKRRLAVKMPYDKQHSDHRNAEEKEGEEEKDY